MISQQKVSVKNSSPADFSLNNTTIFIFGLPMLAGGMINMLAGTFFMKYATDTLWLTPTFIGFVLFISRVWDAVNDPIIGWLNDRSSRKGKRARWIFFSSFAIGFLFYLLWFPPTDYQKIFITVVLLLFFTAFTAMFVPHYSLGADISNRESERNKLFGFRAVCEYLGTFGGVGVMWYLSDPLTARQKAHGVMGLILIFTVFSAGLLFARFRNFSSRFQSDIKIHEFLASFFKNRHAAIIIGAGFFNQLGASFVFTLSLYYSQYVLQNADSGNLIIGLFLLAAMLSIFLWVLLLKKFEKKTIWITANVFIALSFMGTFYITANTIWLMYCVAVLSGFFAGAILIIHPAALADTIDYDEMLHGKNNAATYFSFFTFVNKSAMGVAAILVGALLKFGGYLPNMPQTPFALQMMRFSYAFVPVIIFTTSTLILYFYTLNKKTHAFIKEQLDKKTFF